MTGLTESLLSQIENSKANPSITTLLSISKALNTPAGAFFETSTEHNSPVVRKNERPLSQTSNGINYYLLTPDLSDSPIEVLYNEFQPGADTGESIRHEGVECAVVLEGKLEVTIDERVYILNAGDSITINSDTPHKVRNISERVSSAVWIDSPPSF